MDSKGVKAMGSRRHHILMAMVKEGISTVTTELLQHLDGGLSASYQVLNGRRYVLRECKALAQEVYGRVMQRIISVCLSLTLLCKNTRSCVGHDLYFA